MTEQQPYEVVREHDGFELRRYPAHVVAETTVDAEFDDAGNRAFRFLFGYISGENERRQSISMTSPVVQSQKIAMTAPVTQRADGDQFVVAFVLPADFTEESAPVPAQPQVTIRTVPAALSAVTRFSGRWTRASFEEHRAALLTQVAAAASRPSATHASHGSIRHTHRGS